MYCLLRQNRSSEKKFSIMDHPDLTVSNFMEDSIGCIRVKNDNTFFFQIRLKSSNIKFMELKPSDRGNYTCVASNSAGTLEYTFILNVIGM